MKALHLICRRYSDRPGLKGLKPIPGETALYRSSCWALSEHDARTLTGGWVYLHPSKSDASEFGGVVRTVEFAASGRDGKAKGDGFDLIIESRSEGRNQVWRGAGHQMAWNGGIVDASLGHELRVPNADRL